MLETPGIVTTEVQPTAVTHVTVPRAEIRLVMGPGLQELLAAVSAQGIAPTGPWFTHHLRVDPDVFDFEIGVPVPRPIVAAGRTTPSTWPAMTAARAIYHGDFDGLGAAWDELDRWIATQGRTPAPDFWERYLVGPEASADPSDWRTELTRALTASANSGGAMPGASRRGSPPRRR